MEHEALKEVIDRLIMSGLNEADATMLVARLLDQEAEFFLKVTEDLPRYLN